MGRIIYIILFLSCLNSYGQNRSALLNQLRQQQIQSTTPLTEAPVMTNFRIENSDTDRIYFDASSDVTGLTTQGFIITENIPINSITIDGDGLGGYITLDEVDFNFWDNNAIRLEGGDGTVPDFTLTYIENNIAEPTTSGDRYVTTSANGSGDGTSEANAWTMTQAIASTGNYTIHVKAGTYNGRYSLPYRSSTHVIKFVGYKNTIGDITQTVGRNEPIDATEFPVLDGGNRATGTTLTISSRSNYIFENIRFTGSETGVLGYTVNNFVFKNCTARDNGALNANGGSGFQIEGLPHTNVERIRFENCSATNNTAANFHTIGNNVAYINCFSYCDQAPAGASDTNATTDYYYEVSGSNNSIVNSEAYKNTPNGDGHLGHGFSLKAVGGNSYYNLVDGCVAIGIYGGAQLRWTGSRYNVIKNNIFHADIGANRRPGFSGSGGVQFYSGADYNIIENNTIYEVDAAFTFNDKNESDPLISNADAGRAGSYNIIRNNLVYDSKVYLKATNANSTTAVNVGNKHYNNIVYNIDDMFKQDDSNMTFADFFRNNIVHTVPSKDETATALVGFTYENNAYYNSYTTPAGTGNITTNPYFNSPTTGDFTFTGSSPTSVTEGGQTLSDVILDINGKIRTAPYSIGAYEE